MKTMTTENNKRWILDVQENEQGEQFIEFPEDFLKETGWKEGDAIEWIDNHDGSWTMKKKDT
jgi:hypothetical protein